ncbi:MAG: decaprenyl-phosphate phosphoribosyltransferase, partial [Mycobacteriaceae bacterium]|nr:decaprenyl-phosphate phosphoribosyltransferase [Mycobacteriaceae bacterium]
SQEPSKPAASGSKLAVAVKLLRPRQWTKNLIAVAPILFSAKLQEIPLLINVVITVVALCCVSSSVYIINDIMDRESDRVHPTKCKRPIASGRVPLKMAVFIAFVLASSAVSLGFVVRPMLALIIVSYLVLMLFYTTKFKHIVLLDVFTIATGFVLRAAGGAAAAYVPVSGWFLLCTSFGSLFLALEKRRQELKLLKGEAETHRKTLTIYTQEMVDRMESVVVPSLLTCYTFYGFQSSHGQNMLLTVPFVVYGIMRYQVLSVKSDITGTPEEVLLKDRHIQLAILGWLVTSAAVVYNLIPTISTFVIPYIDSIGQQAK